ncbi:unnamed protein product [Dracunculus medinensis]|uniref:Activin_recp domain-containing protein n=1 Tax=Dracunculus medinensis TaxID=318479 RepID=A0A158Q373_DRAME|nr:unnamed protein product [Dracunculus medinensis]
MKIFQASLICYDGADCLINGDCAECSGVACIRLQSFKIDHNHAVAFTCLPYATRPYQLEPSGCHVSRTGDGEVCICYEHDYCNNIRQPISRSIFLLMLFALIFPFL